MKDNYQKEFTSHGYHFIMSVKLNYTSQKHMAGESWHKVTVNNTTGKSEFYRSHDTVDENLVDTINNLTMQAEAHAKNDGPIIEKDARLVALGFS